MVLVDTARIEISPLRLMEVPDPWPQPGEIRVKVAYCAICRDDLHAIENEAVGVQRPLIPGHQIVGTVDVVGKGSRRFSVGQRVAIARQRHCCGTCVFCQGGSENLCESSQFTGFHREGGFAEYAVVSEAFAYALPESGELAELAPLLCAGFVGYRALNRVAIAPGGTLGLFGFGPAAHSVLQIARKRGLRVYVVSQTEEHRNFAKRMGADWVGKSTYELPRKLDGAISFSPAGELIPSIFMSMRKGGTLVTTSRDLTPIPPLDYEKSIAFERTLCSVVSAPRSEGQLLLEEAGKAGARTVVTLYRLAEANRALQDLKAGRLPGTAVLVI